VLAIAKITGIVKCGDRYALEGDLLSVPVTLSRAISCPLQPPDAASGQARVVHGLRDGGR
jgi:hypothetical protein